MDIDLREGTDSKRTVALCDDDPMLRSVVSSMLRADGWDVVVEADMASDLLSMVEATKPDLCIIDVSLHGMTGIEAIPRLRWMSPSTQILVLTSFDSAATEALDAGADCVLTKSELTRLDEAIAGMAFEAAELLAA